MRDDVYGIGAGLIEYVLDALLPHGTPDAHGVVRCHVRRVGNGPPLPECQRNMVKLPLPPKRPDHTEAVKEYYRMPSTQQCRLRKRHSGNNDSRV
jgi:hypothetical protein